MNYPVQGLFFPAPPKESSEDIVRYLRSLERQLKTYSAAVSAQLNSQVQSVGAVLASTATLTLTNPIHHVSGTQAIKTLVAPSGFTGPIMLVPDGLWTTVTGGNIALASTAVVNKVLILVFDGKLWSPSY